MNNTIRQNTNLRFMAGDKFWFQNKILPIDLLYQIGILIELSADL